MADKDISNKNAFEPRNMSAKQSNSNRKSTPRACLQFTNVLSSFFLRELLVRRSPERRTSASAGPGYKGPVNNNMSLDFAQWTAEGCKMRAWRFLSCRTDCIRNYGNIPVDGFTAVTDSDIPHPFCMLHDQPTRGTYMYSTIHSNGAT